MKIDLSAQSIIELTSIDSIWSNSTTASSITILSNYSASIAVEIHPSAWIIWKKNISTIHHWIDQLLKHSIKSTAQYPQHNPIKLSSINSSSDQSICMHHLKIEISPQSIIELTSIDSISSNTPTASWITIPSNLSSINSSNRSVHLHASFENRNISTIHHLIDQHWQHYIKSTCRVVEHNPNTFFQHQ